MQALSKSRLSRVRVAPAETAMTDVLREVSILLHDDSIPVSPVPWCSNSCHMKMYMGELVSFFLFFVFPGFNHEKVGTSEYS